MADDRNAYELHLDGDCPMNCTYCADEDALDDEEDDVDYLDDDEDSDDHDSELEAEEEDPFERPELESWNDD